MPVSRDLINSELAKPWNAPRAPELLRLHDADESHYRYARQTTIIAAILYISFVLSEPFLMHGTLLLSMGLRLVFSPAVLAALLWYFSRRPPLFRVHLSMGLTVVLATAVWSWIMLSGTYDGPNYYFFTGVLFLPTSNIFMRLKFKVAVLSSVLQLLIIAIDAALIKQTSAPMLLVAFLMDFIIVVQTLYANWTLEQKSYEIFLRQLLGALDQDELAKRNLELQALSSTDALTGIGNRRAAEAVVDELWRAARQGGGQEGRPVALAIIDVDFFKLYNDHYGHVAGDTCLRMVAEAAQTAAQHAGARVFRLGGEEFVMVLACDHAQAALDAALAIKDAVLAREIAHESRADALGRVSVSVGVAFHRDVAAERLSDFFQAADLALYRAKATGRNRVVAFSAEMLVDTAVPSLRDRPRDAFAGK